MSRSRVALALALLIGCSQPQPDPGYRAEPEPSSTSTSTTPSTGTEPAVFTQDGEQIIGSYGGQVIEGTPLGDRIYPDGVEHDALAYEGLSCHDGPTQAALPGCATSLELWLDAADARGDGTSVGTEVPVDRWVDLSGQALDAGVDLGEPTMDPHGIRGRPAVHFHGTDRMTHDALDFVDQYTAFYVAGFDTTIGTVHMNGDSGASGWGVLANVRGQKRTILFGGRAIKETSPAQLGDEIWTAQWDGDESDLWVNGVDQTLTDERYVEPRLPTLPGHIGANQAGTAGLVGHIGEMIVFRGALSTEARQSIEQALSMKFGLEHDGVPLGRDVLTGGAGSDVFVWTVASHSEPGFDRDRIEDFDPAEGDRIDLSDHPGTFVFHEAGDGPEDFVVEGGPQVAWRVDTMPPFVTVVYVDTDGDGVQELEIELAGEVPLTAEAFVL